jgi:phosphatidylglycerophosphate synthase
MLDIALRPLKDRIFDPLCGSIPGYIFPGHVTFAAFVSGLLCCLCACLSSPSTALSFWILNRALDCLDGALARRRGQVSDVGGFLDLLGDFIIYSLIPISCAVGAAEYVSSTLDNARVDGSQFWLWLPVTVVEASFHVNNFVLFYVAAVVERKKSSGVAKGVKEWTSVAMRPALIEGAESGLLFTAMLIWPHYVHVLSWLMAVLVSIGIVQRVLWLIPVLA